MTREYPRYRVEGGEHIIDVRLASLDQMFDNRDPAPFRERDLDPSLVAYLMGAAEDLSPYGSFRVVIWFPAARSKEDITQVEHGLRAHLDYELEILERRRRRQRRTGQVSLLLALALVVVLQMLAQLVFELPETSVRNAVREGLVVLSWVVLWRPIDLLIYEWIPVHRRRTLLQRLRIAAIDVRQGSGPVGGGEASTRMTSADSATTSSPE